METTTGFDVDLSQYDDRIEQFVAEAAAGLPDGDYTFVIDKFSVRKNDRFGKYECVWSLRVAEGDCAGQVVEHVREISDDKNRLFMLKGDLKASGHDGKIAEIQRPDVCERFAGRGVVGNVKNKTDKAGAPVRYINFKRAADIPASVVAAIPAAPTGEAAMADAEGKSPF